jgi:hypothetical protein
LCASKKKRIRLKYFVTGLLQLFEIPRCDALRASSLIGALARSWISGCFSLVPKIIKKDGFVSFFYSNDHQPVHIHVRRGSGEAVFDSDNGVELRESQGMSSSAGADGLRAWGHYGWF